MKGQKLIRLLLVVLSFLMGVSGVCQYLLGYESTKSILNYLAKVRPFLCLGVLAVQIAMTINIVFGLPFRQISSILPVLN